MDLESFAIINVYLIYVWLVFDFFLFFLQAKVWDLRTNNVMRSFSNHPGGIYSVCFTEDGQKLFTGSIEKVYDLTQIYIYI